MYVNALESSIPTAVYGRLRTRGTRLGSVVTAGEPSSIDLESIHGSLPISILVLSFRHDVVCPIHVVPSELFLKVPFVAAVAYNHFLPKIVDD